MARENKVWAVVDTTSSPTPTVKLIESSELRALRAAVATGDEVVAWRFGEGIGSAIGRRDAERTRPPAKAPGDNK